MRSSCLFCVSKHISQAIVLTIESVQGYPIHLWLAVGHLAEAESEACAKYPDFAKEIRNIRLALMGQKGTFREESLMELLKKVRSLAERKNGQPEEQRIEEILHVEERAQERNYLPVH
jgi:vacuolar-type H+-ATPase subunit C/Vma6